MCVRTGVKPVLTACNARLTRGVVCVFSASGLGTLSTVNPCGGRLSQSSKSSGARRFLPRDEEGEVVMIWGRGGGGSCCCGCDFGARLDSGVLALNTGGGGTLDSGVLGLAMAEPDACRREVGVDGACRVGGVREEEAMGAMEGIGGMMVAGPERRCADEGALPDEFEDNLACKLLTFLVRVSTLDVSFFFSLRSLKGIMSKEV